MLLSVVLPIYNEQAVLPKLLDKLRSVLGQIKCDYELVFVDDGSSDASLQILQSQADRDRRVKVLRFTRNFGHQAAITAGMDFAVGDAVAVMDADLQDPPELLVKMMSLLEAGYDVVSAQRVARTNDTFFKRTTARMFYWLMRHAVDQRLPPQVADFRLFSRNAIRAMCGFREQHRFMRGLVAWLGLKEATVPFERPPRAGGEAKYSTWKMIRFAWTAITSFSGAPLRFGMATGALLVVAGIFYFIYAAYEALILRNTVPGWASLLFFQVLFSGMMLLAIGMIGDYIARIYEELKGRPLYVVGDRINMPEFSSEVPRALVLTSRKPADVVRQ
jgi:glycosyltransferase involved in cell wall biosynthesis